MSVSIFLRRNDALALPVAADQGMPDSKPVGRPAAVHTANKACPPVLPVKAVIWANSALKSSPCL